MIDCPYCKNEVIGILNFCLNCDRQVKCLNCSGALFANKTLCLLCGKPVNAQESNSSPINELILDEQQNTESSSRRVSVRFSDNVASEVVSLLGLIPSKSHPIKVSTTTNPFLEPFLESSEPDIENENSDNDTDLLLSTQMIENIASNNQAQNLFEMDGEDNLISSNPDYKGKSKKAQQHRFILLYVCAYHDIFNGSLPSKDHINKAAKSAGLHDQNFAANFTQTAKENLIHTSTGAGYKLNTIGNQKVKEFIEEINNSEIKGFSYWNQKPKGSRKRASFGKEDQEKINNWISQQSEFDDFDIRKLDSGRTCALFSLWLLTKKLSLASAVKPGEVFAFIKGKYTTISITKDAVSAALSKMSDRFGKTSEGLYFLTEKGEQEIEDFLESDAI